MITSAVLNLGGVAPQLIVAGTGMLVMLLDAVFRRSGKRWAAYLALLGLAAALGWIAVSGLHVQQAFVGALAADGLSTGVAVVLLLAGCLSILLAMDYLRREGLEYAEYYALILFATAGALAMAAAGDLIVMFIGLEVLSISLYVLAGFAKGDPASREAGLKYLLLGAFASAFFLYGIAMLYGATGTTRLAEMAAVVSNGTALHQMLWVGTVLLAVGLGFKLALVPFHTWAPDVYQGAPTPVTAFMSVTSKAAAFAALLRLLVVALGPAQALTGTVLAVLAVLTMTVGNIVALAQDDVKRLLAYSSIAQAGYVLVALAGGGNLAPSAVLFYLLGYALTNLGAFAVIIVWGRPGESRVPLADLAGLGFKRPWLAAALTLFLLSLAGIPPTAGFMGKLYLFGAAVQAGWVWLAIVAVLNSVVAAFYYLHVVVVMYMREPVLPTVGERPSLVLGVAVVVCVAGVLVLGLVPGPVLEWARQALALL